MPEPYFADEHVTVYAGDCLDVLAELADASVDSVVTDPPYGLEFMGKDWDRFDSRTGRGTRVATERAAEFTPAGQGHSNLAARVDSVRVAGRPFQDWCQQWATECLRVLKPGGHMLAFGGTRTWHRLAAAVEDAGFEIRDSIAWLYGSGFPKSLDVSKAIDRAAGAEREAVSVNPNHRPISGVEYDGIYAGANTGASTITAPATEAAKQWQGWGTALKPAFEPIVVARKPLQGTVAANVQTHGVGAINIDACRVNPGDAVRSGGGFKGGATSRHEGWTRPSHVDGNAIEPHTAGRWPANVVLDDTQAAELDKQSGTLSNCGGPKTTTHDAGMFGIGQPGHVYTDSGGASRFFPTFDTTNSLTMPWRKVARIEQQPPDPYRTASMTDLMAVCDECSVEWGWGATFERLEKLINDHDRACHPVPFPTFRYAAKAPTTERPTADGIAHPTVKPVDLMRWLIRLVTPPGGVVLDPFAGSGTTGEAAIHEHKRAILIEREPTYLPLITARIRKPIQTGFDFNA